MREGDRFGNYLLDEKLAQGGMAEVFRARRIGARGFQRDVCIKRILPALCHDRAFVQMFIDEAQTCSVLRHSNIVAIDDFGEIDGQLFSCMEWVNGKDAARVLKCVARDRQGFPVEAALFLVGEVLQGLEYAHTKTDQGRPLGIVHRDVSPHNILVSYAGEVKLTDFGIAKASSRLHQTLDDTVKGKIAYMAPEQATNRPLDGRADLFALGIVAYELLAGRRPFVGHREGEVIFKLLRGDRPRLRDACPDVPIAVEAFVDGLLEVDRDRRFPDASAALEALAAIQSTAAGRTALRALMAEYFPGEASVVHGRSWVPGEGPEVPLAVAATTPARASASVLSRAEAAPAAPLPTPPHGTAPVLAPAPAPETSVPRTERIPSTALDPLPHPLTATAVAAAPVPPPDFSVRSSESSLGTTPGAATIATPPPARRLPAAAIVLLSATAGVLGTVAALILLPAGSRPQADPHAAVARPDAAPPPALDAAAPPHLTRPAPHVVAPHPPVVDAAVRPVVVAPPPTPRSTASPATLDVSVTPWGSVEADGRPCRRTGERSASCVLSPGSHTIRAHQGGASTLSATQHVSVRAGERRSITLALHR